MAGKDKKNEIIQVARKIFAYYGYDKTTLDDIGKAIGMNKTSLYYYYKNKESIFVDVLDLELDSFLSDTMIKLESVEGNRNKILAYLRELLNYSKNAANLIGLSNENMQSVRPYVRKITQDFLKKHMNYISENIQIGIDKGEFKACDTERIAMSILRIADTIMCKNNNRLNDSIINENEENNIENDVILLVSLVLEGLMKV